MSKTTDNENKQHETNDLSYTPATTTKRIMAWIGLTYMAILLSLTTYFYFTATMLTNLAPILSIPALVGAGVILLIKYRADSPHAQWIVLAGAILCFIAAIVSIPIGLIGLMSNFGG